MSGTSSGLARVIEAILTAGLAASATLLLAGLTLGSAPALEAGVLVLILTPVARVVALTAGLFQARDWTFALLSLAVLAVLGSSAWLGWSAGR